MRTTIRNIIKQIAPGMHEWLMQRWGRGGKDYRLKLALRNSFHGQVLRGPFAGMIYDIEAFASAYYPKLLGSYESELHNVLTSIIKRGYKLIIDVGCAEGYYAVGLALRCPQSSVVAVDTDPRARELCCQLAEKNAVGDRITSEPACNHHRLAELTRLGNCLLISDCEGFELELLQPEIVPSLRHTDILVELHDCIIPGLTTRLVDRFVATHSIEIIKSATPEIGSQPEIKSLSRADQIHALRERSFAMQWAWLQAKV